MKKTAITAFSALLSIVAFAQNYNMTVTKHNGQTISIPAADIEKIEFAQGQGVGSIFEVTPQSTTVPYFGGNVSFKINANCQWTYKTDNSAIREVSVSNTQLVLDFPAKSTDEDVTFSITFQYSGQETGLAIKQDNSPRADLLDIEFLADGTGVDVSPMKHNVITKPSASLLTYYNDIHKRYVASMRNSMGEVVTTGYYRVKYTKGGEFINRIADGCTFESIIKLNEPDNPSREVKWFSSMQAGGIGFILPIHSSVAGTTNITFLPNVSTTGSSNWRWTYSSTKPEVGKYYHVVGVWNKEEGKAYVYVNGMLGGTQSAPGNYVPVANGAESFVIGGDPGTNDTDCDASFNGEIVTARIYDKALNATQVAKLWEAAKFEQVENPITISDLTFLSNCQVAPGAKYSIYGKGFENGDVIELIDTKGNVTPAATSVADGRIIATIPEGFTAGTYNIVLKRGSNSAPLFQATFTIGSDVSSFQSPKVIAHRGEHTGGATENSVAALSKAMDSNYYGIEFDTWITTDGVVVVHHDGVANGMTFQNCTYDQIKNIKLANGESLPTFDSFVKKFKEKMNTSSSKMIIEIKSHNSAARNNACVDKVMETIEAEGLKDRVEYIAFSWDNCRRIVSKDPNAMVGYLSGDLAPSVVLNAGVKSIDYSYAAYGSHPEWIKQAKALGMVVNVWTINSRTEMLNYISQGADYITTDAPATLAELCKMAFIEK